MRLTKNLLLASLFVFALPFLLLNCRKIDRPDLQSSDDVQKFFALPAGTDPVVAAISQNMLRQEQQKPYVAEFVKQAGYPRWDKSLSFSAPATARQAGVAKGNFILVPFSKDSQTVIYAIVVARVSGADTSFSTIYHWQYKSYLTNRSLSWVGVAIAQLFMYMDYLTYGYERFELTDSDLADKLTVVSANAPFNVAQSGQNFLVMAPQETDWNAYWNNWWQDVLSQNPLPVLPPAPSPGGGGGNTGWNENPCRTIGPSNDPCSGSGGWQPVYPVDDNILLPPYVINDLTKPCLVSVLKKISGGTQNTFFKQIYNVFDTSTNLILGFRDSTISSAYGTCSPPIPLSSGGSYIDITLNNTFLLQCSREWISYVMIHEVAHAGMFVNIVQWDTLNSQHTAMAGQFLTLMANSITASYPGLSEFDAYTMCFAGFYNGIEGNPTPEDIAFSLVIANRIRKKFGVAYTDTELANRGRQYAETGTKGTRGNCN